LEIQRLPKTKLYKHLKHIETRKETRLTTKLNKKREKKNLELNTSKQKLFKLDF